MTIQKQKYCVKMTNQAQKILVFQLLG